MELRDYVRLLRRSALMIILVVALSAALGVAYLNAQPKVYQASTTLLVTPLDASTLGDLQTGNAYAESAASTIAALVQTPAVLDNVAQDVALGSVSAGAQASSALVVISSTSDSAVGASDTANAVAQSAVEIVPGTLSSRRSGANRTPLLELQVIQPAVTPSSPVSPNDRRILALFLVLGLAIGLAIALVRQSLDTVLRRSEDVAAVTVVPILATVTRERRSKRPTVVVRDAPSSPAVEGYRGLRTTLSRLDSDARRSVLVVSASDDGSGAKVPVNLAWSLAVAGRRTLLLDLDLRRGEIASTFGLTSSPGAIDLLTGSLEIAQVVQSTALPKLDVVASGSADQAPSDLLSDQWLSQLVRLAEQEYDYVILHAPPLLSFTDAAVVARVAAQSVVSVRANHTKAPDLMSALGVLASVGVSPLGLVLREARLSVPDNIRARGRAEQPRGRKQRLANRRSAKVDA